MKKLIFGLLVLIAVLLLFFTQFGETLYAIGKPRVTLSWVSTYAGSTTCMIPIEALREDEAGSYVYVLQEEEGYSRTIYTVARRNVEVLSRTPDADRYTLTAQSEATVGDRVVVDASDILADGSQVVIGW